MDIDIQGCDDKMAVVFRNVTKSYEKGKVPLLSGFNMNVPKGSIYSLLGASGCGKTTVINIAVGLLKFTGDSVKILGGTPGKKDSGVPGPRVGYMPQDSALVSEFTVSGVLYYFGWLYGMTNKEIKERFDFLAQLLQLPPGGQMINTLSGGQQRRLSFAAAIVHSPELLVMDEPTVGLDPILRESIWNYLLKLSAEQGVTIFLTTHYIEEARQCQRIGLLRNGVMLAETSPNYLLSKYSCDTLEEAFLHLSQIQSGQCQNLPEKNNQIQDQTPGTSYQQDCSQNNDMEISLQLQTLEINPVKNPVNIRQPSCRGRMKSLLYKNFSKTFKNKVTAVFNFGYEIVFLFAFFMAVGKDPVGLPVAVVNQELGNCHTLPGGIGNHSGVQAFRNGDDEVVCTFKGMSCLFLNQLDADKTVIRYYDTLDEGIAATSKGETLATLYFSKEFTKAQQERFDDPFATSNTTLNVADVRIWIDMAEYTIGNTLKLHFHDTMVDILKYVARQCELPEKAIVLPVKIEDPLYGKMNGSFRDFMAPGMIMAMFYCVTVLMTSNEIVTERAEGLWNRNVVAGVTDGEIIASHILALLLTVVIQLAEAFVFAIFLYDLEIVGSIIGSLLLVLSQALCGASMGLLISVMTNDISQAMLMSMSSFLPYILLCGIVWPLEGMYPWLQTMSYLGPGTWPIVALRNIFIRGWPITHAQVYPGYIVSTIWFCLFTALSVVGLKMKN